MMIDRLRRKPARKAPPSAERRNAAWLANSRARAERHGAPHEDVSRADIWRASGGRCHVCGRAWAEGGAWQGDHVIPISRGGLHVLANLRVACPDCNRRKSARKAGPPAAVRDAARAIAWYASARLAKPGARVTPRARVVGIVRAPQCWTARLAVDPRDMPRLLEPELAEIIAAGLGLRAPVGIVRDGAHLAVQVPLSRPDIVRLATMPADGGRVGIGIGTDGAVLSIDLAHSNTAHVFIAGTTGSGKTTLGQSIIALLARANDPEQLRIVGIDVKRELFTGPLATLPHLLYRIADTPEDGAALIAWVAAEIARRNAGGVRHPRILVAIDEAWSIDAGELEAIARLGRSRGVHLLAMTQRGVSGDMAKDVLTQFGVRICGLLGPDDGWTARNMGAGDLYQALLHSGDFCASIAGDPSRGPRRFQAAYAGEGDAFWDASAWPEPVNAAAIPGRQRSAAQGRAQPAARMTLDDLVEIVRREYNGVMRQEHVRRWSIERGLGGAPGKGIGTDTARAIVSALTGSNSTPDMSPG